jgi:hypothetical protein
MTRTRLGTLLGIQTVVVLSENHEARGRVAIATMTRDKWFAAKSNLPETEKEF